jgi:hypothetical protein
LGFETPGRRSETACAELRTSLCRSLTVTVQKPFLNRAREQAALIFRNVVPDGRGLFIQFAKIGEARSSERVCREGGRVREQSSISVPIVHYEKGAGGAIRRKCLDFSARKFEIRVNGFAGP